MKLHYDATSKGADSIDDALRDLFKTLGGTATTTATGPHSSSLVVEFATRDAAEQFRAAALERGLVFNELKEDDSARTSGD